MTPLAVVFDRDGVLTTTDHARFARDVLARIPLPEVELARRWRAWLGGRALRDAPDEAVAIEGFLRALANELGLDRGRQRALASIDYTGCVRAFGDARGALVETRRRGLRAGVLTNNSAGVSPRRMLAAAGLDELIDVALSSQMIGAAKPEPAAYHAIAKALDVPASRCLFFDDAGDRVEGARVAGMAAWLVDRTRADHRLELAIVHDLSALSAILDRAGGSPLR